MSQSVRNHGQRCQRVAMPEIADRPRPWLLQRSQFILFGAEVLGRGVLRKARISYYRNREGGLAKRRGLAESVARAVEDAPIMIIRSKVTPKRPDRC